ncbi:MAG: 2-oxoacid:acceptor oxidoreductase family protein [Candidatus Cloacimonetes bacterium]|nr:2-oxoacid:acceptor oxidoreductase family protein [Candidatus Cloacimonadota bacterium]
MENKRIKISGFGGQGIILSAHIVGQAASIYDGKNASMTQAYGPEARGGACSSQVVISDTEVDYPLVDTSDVLLALSQEGYDKFVGSLRDGGILCYDNDLVGVLQDHSRFDARAIPATRIAEELGKKIVANIVMLGFATRQAGFASYDAMKRTVLERVPPKFRDLNETAFERGYNYGEEVQT